MILIGHPWIESEFLRRVYSTEEIQNTNPQQVLVLEALEKSHHLAQYLQQNDIAFALPITTPREAVLANALGAKYILCTVKEAKGFQKIATEYLFDTRVLVEISEEHEIDSIVLLGVDGVVFKDAII